MTKKMQEVKAQGPPWTSGQGPALGRVSRAQGTIEYLVILAVVVVISLVVVALVTGMFQSSSTQISSANDKIGNLTTGGISIVDSVTDSGGDSLVRLQNNSGESLTLEKVSVGDNETIFNEQLVSGDAKSFSLSDLDLSCPCVEGQESVSCSFTFYLTTQTGLSKKQTTIIKTDCQETVEAVNPVQVVGLGSGTLADPWIINSCRELQEINSHLDGNYKLGADINCLETSSWNSGSGFVPIGQGSSFTGNLNGNSKTISGIYINLPTTDYVGLFGETIGATISNVKLIDANVIGQNRVGPLVGWQYTGGTITNSSSSGSVRGYSRVGGLVGSQTGLILDCYSHTIVNGNDRVGGLVGYNLSGTTLNSYATGSVTSTNDYTGGLTGWLFGGTISTSYATGVIYGNGAIGGLVGYWSNGGGLSYSYSTGSVTSINDYDGGLVGGITGTIVSSYWDVTLSGQASCYYTGSSGCTSTDNNVIAYYGTDGVAKLNSDGNWVARDGNYPILNWQ